MTEIERYEQRTPALTDAAPQTLALAAWAESAQAAYGVAARLVVTSFVPEAFRGKPEEATAAILSGAEVGLGPMAALRSFDVIQGTAAPRANTLRAVVQAAGHDVWVIESTETRAIVGGKRRNSMQEQRSTWTIDRAKKLGLTGKKNWIAQPQAMLVARATAELCRLIASDAILGLAAYSVEELADGDTVTTEPQTVAEPAKRRTAQRALRPAETPAAAATPAPPVERELPPLPGETGYDDTPLPPEPDDVDEDTGEIHTPDPDAADPNQATPKQVKLIQMRAKDHGVTERDWILEEIGGFLAKPLDSSKELTKAEASRILDELWPAKEAA